MFISLLLLKAPQESNIMKLSAMGPSLFMDLFNNTFVIEYISFVLHRFNLFYCAILVTFLNEKFCFLINNINSIISFLKLNFIVVTFFWQ